MDLDERPASIWLRNRDVFDLQYLRPSMSLIYNSLHGICHSCYPSSAKPLMVLQPLQCRGLQVSYYEARILCEVPYLMLSLIL